jgi:hypothetical protein
MSTSLIRRHFERTLEMLGNAIDECPDDAWDAPGEHIAIWQHAYHSLMGLDVWIRYPDEPFVAPPFHSRAGADLVKNGDAVMSRDEISGYRDTVFARCRNLLVHLTPEELNQVVEFRGIRTSLVDRMLEQLRHIQHHVGSMHTQLKRTTGKAPAWVGLP